MAALSKYQTSITVSLALIASLAAAFYASKRTKDGRIIVTVCIIVAIVAFLISKIVIEATITAIEKPKQAPVPNDTPGTNDTGNNGGAFDPRPFTDRLKADIYNPAAYWGGRDDSIYQELSEMSNESLVLVYNDWTNRYWSEDNETMVQAMKGETYGIFTDVARYSENIVNRLAALNLM